MWSAGQSHSSCSFYIHVLWLLPPSHPSLCSLVSFSSGSYFLSCRYASSSWQEKMKAYNPRSQPFSLTISAEKDILSLRIMYQFLGVTVMVYAWRLIPNSTSPTCQMNEVLKEDLETMNIPGVDGQEGSWLDSTMESTWNVEQGTVPRGPSRTSALCSIFDNYI